MGCKLNRYINNKKKNNNNNTKCDKFTHARRYLN